GRVESCRAERPDTTSCARRRDSLIWRLTDSASKIMALSAVQATRSGRLSYSHSMVPGGLEVTSYTTRLIPRTSFTMRLEMILSTSYGSGTQSAVMPSSEWTARIAQV